MSLVKFKPKKKKLLDKISDIKKLLSEIATSINRNSEKYANFWSGILLVSDYFLAFILSVRDYM